MKFKIFSEFDLVLFIVCALIWILPSCSKRTVPCGDPIPNIIELTLVDKNDSNLIGKKFDPDSIKLFVKNEKVDVFIEYRTIHINYGELVPYNSENYILYLSSKDSDTLNIKVDQQNSDCGVYQKLGGLKYNFKDILPDSVYSFRFKVIKD